MVPTTPVSARGVDVVSNVFTVEAPKENDVGTCIGTQKLHEDQAPDAALCLEEPGSDTRCAHGSPVMNASSL